MAATAQLLKCMHTVKHLDVNHSCIICNTILPIWQAYADDCGIKTNVGHYPKDPSADPDEKCSLHAFNLPGHMMKQLPLDLDFLRNVPDDHTFAVDLDKGQIGEAYHILFCCLLLKHSPKINIRVNFAAGDDEMRDLFQWYHITVSPAQSANAGSTSKGEATRIIAAAFRASNNPDSQDITKFLSHNQEDLFDQLRSHVNSEIFPYIVKKGKEKPMNLAPEHFWPSYAADCWLKEYFRITAQAQLPEATSVERIAVIHVRRNALTPVGRIMDPKCLEYVANSISSVNRMCVALNGIYARRFTHVILYGDFTEAEGAKMVADVKKQQHRNTPVQVQFIGSPWKVPDTAPAGSNTELRDLRARFRDVNFDHLPVQVKVLSIWSTLSQKYGDKLCVIGHRSGFVEGAGLLGIPIFYLNNERKKIGTTEELPGAFLWSPMKNPEHDRLRELSDTMNTFIPVEVLLEPEGAAAKTQKVLQVDPKYLGELKAALFMYMCCERVAKTNSEGSTGATPGWKSRVFMMHDKCKEKHLGIDAHEPGVACRDDQHYTKESAYQTGQEWLRRRYNFATRFRDGSELPFVRLTPWVGLEDWTKG
ncbi:hypothetical protein BU24DRAFT_415561 [Aaosphaeria arxii CBS 175.79]|uniref:Uncharacterized protein n=1 Tax=Aaosphaeria arxii CBS 175.79 TaxID=1450172 RepID=A0A6A5X7B0_9PLEO|nr:uncharacterized protein BU24DRAFT_415561 [Aaosphaeria arxii CBS 175.79]KAF2008823.1 hypothetical protein BU24DRAFT_415561 [Aaosphaeria arxii CBS 175.79]